MIKFSYDLDLDLYSDKPTSAISEEALGFVKDGLKNIQDQIDKLSESIQ